MAFAVTARAPTPVEDHLEQRGLLIKRDDLAAPQGFPKTGKLRGIIAHLAAMRARGITTVAVLDHPDGPGAAPVVMASRLIPGLSCLVYAADSNEERRGALRSAGAYTVYEIPWLPIQAAWRAASDDIENSPLAACMFPLRHAVPETVDQVADEVVRTIEHADRDMYQKLVTLPWLVAATTGHTAAGVCKGLERMRQKPPRVLIHGNFNASARATIYRLGDLSRTVTSLVTCPQKAPQLDELPFPCDPLTGGAALRWWLASGRKRHGEAVFWNVGE